MFGLNVAATDKCSLFIPDDIDRSRGGTIVNISTLGILPGDEDGRPLLTIVLMLPPSSGDRAGLRRSLNWELSPGSARELASHLYAAAEELAPSV